MKLQIKSQVTIGEDTAKPAILTTLAGVVGGKNVEIRLRRPAHLPNDCNTVSAVFLDSQEAWGFKADVPEGFNGLARYHELPEPVIGLWSVIHTAGKKPEETLKTVIPVADLASSKIMSISGKRQRVGLRKPEELLKLKEAIATGLKKKYETSVVEKLVLAKLEATRQAEITARREREEADKQQRLQEKEERISAIHSRPMINFYGADNRKYTGIPVTSAELPMLRPHNYFVVLGEKGEPVETFFLIKKEHGGKLAKRGLVNSGLSLEPKTKKSDGLEVPIASAMNIFDLEGIGIIEVPHVIGGKKAIADLKAIGVNSGSCYSAGNKDARGALPIFCLKGEDIIELGHHIPLSI